MNFQNPSAVSYSPDVFVYVMLAIIVAFTIFNSISMSALFWQMTKRRETLSTWNVPQRIVKTENKY